MRNVVASMFVSLDGVMEDPGGSEGTIHGAWTFPYWNDEIGKVKLAELFAADALLLGRVTYEGFAAAWPERTDEEGFADKFNSMVKYVASTTLTDPAWNNSHVLEGDVPAAVEKLKDQDGEDILIAGSHTLCESLREHGLIDVYRLLVYPLVLGSGKRFFGDGGIATKLELTGSRDVGSGVVLLEYRPA